MVFMVLVLQCHARFYMNNIINIYELLGLIKDGKAPKKIKFDNDVYLFKGKGKYKTYFRECDRKPINNLYVLEYLLNDTVEILEEDKSIIEKIKINKYHFHNTNHSKLLKNQEILETKLNEIIDYIIKKENN